MYVHKDFAFYHMPKVGGTSVIKLLNSLRLPFRQIGKKHHPLSTKKVNLNAYFIYANIRNPFARVVSAYEFNRQFGRRQSFRVNRVTFEDFFNSWYENKDNLVELRSTKEFLFVNDKLPKTVKIVKLEEMDDKWPEIIYRHFDRYVDLVPRENTTVHYKDTMDYYNADLREKLLKKEGWVWEKFYA